MEETEHFRTVLEERRITRDWVDATLSEPERIERHEDGTQHFIKRITEHGDRWLRVVLNTETDRLVTAFFDRRLRKER